MPIDFPNSPANGDSYSVDGKTRQFDGSVWSSVQGSSTIGNSSVATEHLAADSVTGNKIANLAVSNADLAASSVASDVLEHRTIETLENSMLALDSSTTKKQMFSSRLVHLSRGHLTRIMTGSHQFLAQEIIFSGTKMAWSGLK